MSGTSQASNEPVDGALPQPFDSSELAAVVHNVAALYHERGDYGLALRLYQDSLHARMETLHSRQASQDEDASLSLDRISKYRAMIAQEEVMLQERQAEPQVRSRTSGNHTSLVLFPFLGTAKRNPVITGLPASSVEQCSLPAFSQPLHLLHAKSTRLLLSVTDQGQCQEKEVSAATSLYNMGLVHHENGTLEKAYQLFEMALSVLSRQEHAGLVSLLLLNVAQIHCRRNEIGIALDVLSEAFALTKDTLKDQSQEQTKTMLQARAPGEPEPPRTAADLKEIHALSLSLMGQIYYLKGDISNAFDTAVQSLKWHVENRDDDGLPLPSNEHGGNLDHSKSMLEEAFCNYNLGLVHYQRGEVEDAVKQVEHFVSKSAEFYGIDLSTLLDETVSNDIPNLASKGTLQIEEALQTLGSLYIEDASVSSAIRSLRTCLALRCISQGPSSPAVADTLFRIGQILHHTGQNSAAMRYYRQSLHIYKQVIDPNHENMSMIMSSMGQIHHTQGELDESISLYEEVLRMRRVVLGDDGFVADLLCIIGNLHLETGSTDTARSHFIEATRILNKIQQDQMQQLSPNEDGTSMQTSAPHVPVIIPSLSHGFGIEWYPSAAAA